MQAILETCHLQLVENTMHILNKQMNS